PVLTHAPPCRGRMYDGAVRERTVGVKWNPLIAPPFPPQQTLCRPQTVACPFCGNGLIDNEVHTLRKQVAYLVSSVHHGNEEGSFIGGLFAGVRNEFDGRLLIVAVQQNRVEMLRG